MTAAAVALTLGLGMAAPAMAYAAETAGVKPAEAAQTEKQAPSAVLNTGMKVHLSQDSDGVWTGGAVIPAGKQMPVSVTVSTPDATAVLKHPGTDKTGRQTYAGTVAGQVVRVTVRPQAAAPTGNAAAGASSAKANLADTQEAQLITVAGKHPQPNGNGINGAHQYMMQIGLSADNQPEALTATVEGKTVKLDYGQAQTVNLVGASYVRRTAIADGAFGDGQKYSLMVEAQRPVDGNQAGGDAQNDADAGEFNPNAAIIVDGDAVPVASVDADGYEYAATVGLSDKNMPETTEATVEGKQIQLAYSDAKTVKKDDATYVQRTAVASGKYSDGKTWKLTVAASRAEDTALKGLEVSRTDASGKTETVSVPDFSQDKTAYSLSEPQETSGDQWWLNVEAGADAQVGDVTASQGANASRILKVTVNGKTYTVTVSFDKPTLLPDSPASLKSLTADGKPVEGFNPNKTSYTIGIKANDKAPYIAWTAADGATVAPGDVEITSTGSTQKITVTKDGQSRTYTITVVRDHEPTAAEKYKPADPVAQTATAKPASQTDTSLKSWGYVDKSGTYVPVKDTNYQIPDGGAFSYEAKAGQNVSASSKRVSGMTWQYTLSVMAPDMRTVKATTLTVTYITPATHQAALTGIQVNGQAVPGFNASTHDYTVKVRNLKAWTVLPVFDKSTGMSATVRKTGDKAVIAVVSADGLVTTTYTVTAVQDPAATGNGSGVRLGGAAGDGKLAQTGADITPLAASAIVLTVLGTAGIGLSRGKQR